MTDSLIHSTAIVEQGATLGVNVRIGAYSVVGANVVLGDNVTLHSHVVVQGHTNVGAGTTIYPFASIGHPPQDLKYKGEPSRLIIGKNCTIREHVTMNPGTESGGMETTVGDTCLLMVGVHIAHDCRIGNNVIMANNATLGGHVAVGDHVVIGGLAAVHQFIRIGAHAVIGGMSGVDSDVIPFGRVKGERATLAGLNMVGLERRGFTKDQIRAIQKAVNALFDDNGTMDERLGLVAQDYANDTAVMDIIAFAKGKTRFPLCAP
jgi:UDP-N-acetylglucosamine acyltransferase